MVSATKKKMKAELKVEPWAEMDAKTAAWAKGVQTFRKKFKPIVYSQDVLLDTRKWDNKKLSKALYALARYELKVFAVQGSDWCKKVAKGGMKAEIEALAKYPKAYDKLSKDLVNKCSLALDDLEKDKGDNKKSLKNCKAAFATLNGVKVKGIFLIPTDVTVAAFKKLSLDLEKAGDDSRAQDKAYKVAAAATEKAMGVFENNGGETYGGIEMVLKAAEIIKKTKDASPMLIEFGKKIDKYSGVMKGLMDKIEDFGGEIEEAFNDMKEAKIDADDARKMAKRFAEYRQSGSTAASVLGTVGKMSTVFSKIEKELK